MRVLLRDNCPIGVFSSLSLCWNLVLLLFPHDDVGNFPSVSVHLCMCDYPTNLFASFHDANVFLFSLFIGFSLTSLFKRHFFYPPSSQQSSWSLFESVIEGLKRIYRTYQDFTTRRTISFFTTFTHRLSRMQISMKKDDSARRPVLDGQDQLHSPFARTWLPRHSHRSRADDRELHRGDAQQSGGYHSRQRIGGRSKATVSPIGQVRQCIPQSTAMLLPVESWPSTWRYPPSTFCLRYYSDQEGIILSNGFFSTGNLIKSWLIKFSCISARLWKSPAGMHARTRCRDKCLAMIQRRSWSRILPTFISI